jgi:hypothetical protein
MVKFMEKQRHDVLNILRKEQQWHLQQIRRIHLAIEAAKNIDKNQTPPRKISWQSEIEKTFEIQDELRPLEVIEMLIQNGITDAAIPEKRMNIYATLARMNKNGHLEKIDRGTYRRNIHKGK